MHPPSAQTHMSISMNISCYREALQHSGSRGTRTTRCISADRMRAAAVAAATTRTASHTRTRHPSNRAITPTIDTTRATGEG